MIPVPFARAIAWLRRDRVAILLAAHDHEEHLRGALWAEAERLYPGDGAGRAGWITSQCFPDGPEVAQRWPDCDPADPCGTRWENERAAAIWHHCANHLPRGRHRLRLVSDRTEAGL